MQQETISGYYATAFFKEAVKKSCIDEIRSLLENLQVACSLDEVKELIASPSVVKENKVDFLLTALKATSAISINIVKVLVVNKRLDCVSTILTMYNKLDDEENKIVRVVVHIASKIENATKEKLQKAIEPFVVGKKAIIDYVMDKSIIGGFEAHIGDKVIYASLRHMLNSLDI